MGNNNIVVSIMLQASTKEKLRAGAGISNNIKALLGKHNIEELTQSGKKEKVSIRMDINAYRNLITKLEKKGWKLSEYIEFLMGD
jgi:hypothetical protein